MADAQTPAIDLSALIEFVDKKAVEERRSARSRRESAAIYRSGDEKFHREAHKMAERMHGRKFPYTDAAGREKNAQMDERIAQRDDSDAHI